ncbi:MAG: hypothetical protein MEQ07_02355 [Aquimonas sp.]|nr:hypothetical protein [Aquimonas sp.]
MIIPTRYEEWRHCIQEICRIPLTADYVQTRLRELEDPGLHGTQQFLRHYGPEHLARVRAWFEQAGRKLAAGEIP